jgi:hypothetical protein
MWPTSDGFAYVTSAGPIHAYGIFSIRSSADGGKTWNYEYSNFDPRHAESP